MTVLGSTCTRTLIDRTLICNAILYHFQITLFCGRTNRPFIPPTLFLLSRPLEQLEFIRLSNFQQKYVSSPVLGHNDLFSHTTPKSISTTSLHFKLLFQITRARRSLNQLSRLRIHLVQEFHVIRIQSRKNVLETNIVALHDQTPQISLPNPPFLRSRLHRFSRRPRFSRRGREKKKKKKKKRY